MRVGTTSRRRIALSAACLLVILSGCGPRQLSRDEAAALLKQRPEMNKAQMHTFLLGDVMGVGRDGLAAERCGFIQITHPPRKYPHVTLTPKGENEGKLQGWTIYQHRMVIPVAKPEVTAVTGVATTEKSATVKFNWHLGLTETGRALTACGLNFASLGYFGFNQAEIHEATALFQLYDDGWRVEGIQEQ